ncbi:MAG: TIGR03118 family protein, partial [Bdellovibrionales bacterium]
MPINPGFLVAATMVLAISFSAQAPAKEAVNQYVQANLVASDPKYRPLILEKGLVNAWGIANRPAGAGGHFWITARDISFEYVGDVRNASDEKLRALHQDDLKIVKLPLGEKGEFATSTVFINSKENFIITQQVEGADPITAPSKFLFASDGGVISAWTERKKADGTFDRAGTASNVIDLSKEGAKFFGLAASAAYDRIYAADFGKNPGIRVFDGKFKPVNIVFDMPFDSNKNGKVDIGEYAPFNVQSLKKSTGATHVFVAYARTQACSDEGVKKGECAEGELFAGE